MSRSSLPFSLSLLALLPLTGCFELDQPIDVMGNFEVSYLDNLRVFIDDELVAAVESGEDATVEYNGGNFEVSQVCGDAGTDCPSESWWRTVAGDQPWGGAYSLLNFVNLDLERGEPGQRMGGTINSAGALEMVSGLGVAGDNGCAALAVGTVTGAFSADAIEIPDGIIAYEWSGGCQIGEATIATTLRLESDFTAARTGDYDVSSVTPEEPIDAEGEVVDPETPDEGATVE